MNFDSLSSDSEKYLNGNLWRLSDTDSVSLFFKSDKQPSLDLKYLEFAGIINESSDFQNHFN